MSFADWLLETPGQEKTEESKEVKTEVPEGAEVPEVVPDDSQIELPAGLPSIPGLDISSMMPDFSSMLPSAETIQGHVDELCNRIKNSVKEGVKEALTELKAPSEE